MSDLKKFRREEGVLGQGGGGSVSGLTAENIWNSLDILTLFFDQLPSTSISDLKSLRLVNSHFKKLSLKRWRESATVRIISSEEYQRLQHIRRRSRLRGWMTATVTGISIDAFLDKLYQNEKLGEFPFYKFNIGDKVTFPLSTEEEQPFWKRIGPQMKYLRFSAVSFSQRTGINNGFRCLLQHSPNLEELVFSLNTDVRFILFDNIRTPFENPDEDAPSFAHKTLKSLTIEHHEELQVNHYGNHVVWLCKLIQFFKLAPAIDTLRADCAHCSRMLIMVLWGLAPKEKLSLKDVLMKVEYGEQIETLAEYIQSSQSGLQHFNLEIQLNEEDTLMEGATSLVLKHCKDSLENLTLKLNRVNEKTSYRPNFGDLSGCTFSKMTSLTMKLKYWQEGPLGYPRGCSFPWLTTLKIISVCHEGKWFDILTNCNFPLMTHLEVSFDWKGGRKIPIYLDFSGLKGMPKLERLYVRDINKGRYPQQQFANYFVTPYKMLFKSEQLAAEETVKLEDYYNFLCLENMTEFYYPAMFSVDSLLLIRKWMPNIRVLNLKEISLFVSGVTIKKK